MNQSRLRNRLWIVPVVDELGPEERDVAEVAGDPVFGRREPD